MKVLLKKLFDTLMCCLLAGSFGWFLAHEYERWHPCEVKIVCVERPAAAKEKKSKDVRKDVRVIRMVDTKIVK